MRGKIIIGVAVALGLALLIFALVDTRPYRAVCLQMLDGKCNKLIIVRDPENITKF
jgi:hypothetical protein